MSQLSGTVVIFKNEKTGKCTVHGPFETDAQLDDVASLWDGKLGHFIHAIVTLGPENNISFRAGEGLAEYHERKQRAARMTRRIHPSIPYID